jgi:hypothetical protein
MMNKAQLLNKENWLAYLERANEEELTRNAIANDIVSKIAEALEPSETENSNIKTAKHFCYKSNSPCEYDCQGLCKDSF